MDKDRVLERMEWMKRVAKMDLSMSQAIVMMSLVVPDRTMGDLSREVGVTSAAMTGIVDVLEKRGLVYRSSGSDRRKVYLRLTDLGEGSFPWK